MTWTMSKLLQVVFAPFKNLHVLLVLAVLLDASTAAANVTWNVALFLMPNLWWTIPATLIIETPAYKLLERRSWASAALLTLRLNLISLLIGLVFFIPLPNLFQMFSLVYVGNVLIETIAFKRCRAEMFDLKKIWIIAAANAVSTAIPFLQLTWSK